ncbi:MAG: hypothetical protein ACFFDI_03800 [Promethearchaeota archaeon]
MSERPHRPYLAGLLMVSDRAADWRSIRRCRDRSNVGHSFISSGWSIRGLHGAKRSKPPHVCGGN